MQHDRINLGLPGVPNCKGILLLMQKTNIQEDSEEEITNHSSIFPSYSLERKALSPQPCSHKESDTAEVTEHVHTG